MRTRGSRSPLAFWGGSSAARSSPRLVAFSEPPSSATTCHRLSAVRRPATTASAALGWRVREQDPPYARQLWGWRVRRTGPVLRCHSGLRGRALRATRLRGSAGPVLRTRRGAASILRTRRCSYPVTLCPSTHRRQKSQTCFGRTARFRPLQNSSRRRRSATRTSTPAPIAIPKAFWAGFAEELEWFSKWTQGPRLEAAARQVVRRRHSECERQLRRPSRARTAPKQGRDRLGR